MAIIDRVDLKKYFETGDYPTQEQFAALIDNLYHIADGQLVRKIETLTQGYKITTIDGEGNLDEFTIPKLPDNHPISFIVGLQQALDSKVNSVSGKGLSANDFTTELKAKLENLNQYEHPEFHQIVEIENLSQVLDQKVDKVDGKGLSPEEFTASHKQQVADNSTNKQSEITDATGDFTLTDAHFRTTFFINTTGICNVTIPTGILRANFVCYFIVIGTAQLNVMVDGGGATLIAPDGTLITSGGKGVIEKKLALDTFYASGSFEV